MSLEASGRPVKESVLFVVWDKPHQALQCRPNMEFAKPRITYDQNGTPGLQVSSPAEAYCGLGWLHGRHRPVQALVLGAAGQGVLARSLVPHSALVALDSTSAKLDLAARAEAEARMLDPRTAEWLDAYLAGFALGFRERGKPLELRLLAARLPRLDRVGVLAGMMLGSYLGLTQSQERMERAIVDALTSGAEARQLEAMFAPHLSGWDPERLRRLYRAPFARAGRVGGSNAWAVEAQRSASGRPLLCGDPHLQINQLPALFFEVRVRLGDDYWLGATIPGLPGLAVGRNRHVAWSATFSCADNVDFTIETLERGKVRRSEGPRLLVRREVVIERRWRRPLRLTFHHTDRGVLERAPSADGDELALQWAGFQRAAESLAAHMGLPLAKSAAEAEHALARACTYSLHYVLADRGGDVRYVQAGRIPRRTGGWSGLFPVDASAGARWVGFYEGPTLPRARAIDGIVASANEARLASDGAVLSTLPQPAYRLRRITEVLASRRDHDVAGMQALQLDRLSLQARSLSPRFVAALADGPFKSLLAAWDGRYEPDSRGAHAFEVAYRAVVPELLGEACAGWLGAMLEESELGTWWCAGFDRLLAADATWQGSLGKRLRTRLDALEIEAVQPWGEAQRFTLRNMLLGGLPACLGFDRGPFALAGSRATVQQGSLLRLDAQSVAVGPAYRMVADLGDDALWTAVPGGIDGSRFSPSYDRWLDDYLDGRYHRLSPPQQGESGRPT